MNWIQDNITNNFQLLVGTLSPAKALVELVTTYGVVLDEHSKPIAIVTADDLNQAANNSTRTILDSNIGFSSFIIVGYQAHIQELVKWKGFIEQHEKFRGVIVTHDNTVVGILDVTTLHNYFITSDDFELRGNPTSTFGDNSLSGKPQLSKLMLKCGECGWDNELSYFDSKKPPNCKNPNYSHKLKLT